MGTVLGEHLQGHLLWQAQRRRQITRLLDEKSYATCVANLSQSSFGHAPLTIEDLSLDVAQNAVPSYVHAM